MRRRKFTPLVIEQIPNLVGNGKTVSEIADSIGCTVSTLRVRCSQLKISLRRSRERSDDRSEKRNLSSQLNLLLSSAAVEKLRQQAKAERMSDSQYAASLLEAIARDDLYRAVLDTDEAEGDPEEAEGVSQ